MTTHLARHLSLAAPPGVYVLIVGDSVVDTVELGREGSFRVSTVDAGGRLA